MDPNVPIQNDNICKLLRVIELDEILHWQFHLSPRHIYMGGP